jgi:hypothetical protein
MSNTDLAQAQAIKKPLLAGEVWGRLALRVLGSFTGFVQTVLLSFGHARVAGQESCSFERRAEFGVGFDQGPGYPQPDSPRLAGHSSAGHPADDIEPSGAARQFHGLQDYQPAGLVGKEIIEIPIVYRYVSTAGQ